MADDWFRNTNWNDEIRQEFESRLRRARRKEQYLRIQAGMLARNHPLIALELLDRYFQLPDDFDHAQAHVERAHAFLALDRVAEAIDSYEAALRREAAFPNLRTQAWIELPYLVAVRGLQAHYERALEILQSADVRLAFPVDHFRMHAVRALIAAERSQASTARQYAVQALDSAARDHSGYRYHSDVGLVTKSYDGVVRRLEALLAL